jgi:hypothetical protein
MVEAVYSGELQAAYTLSEVATLESGYYCDLAVSDTTYAHFGYGIFVSAGNQDLLSQLNTAMFRLRLHGALDHFYKSKIDFSSDCHEVDSVVSLPIESFIGVWIFASVVAGASLVTVLLFYFGTHMNFPEAMRRLSFFPVESKRSIRKAAPETTAMKLEGNRAVRGFGTEVPATLDNLGELVELLSVDLDRLIDAVAPETNEAAIQRKHVSKNIFDAH